MESVLCTPAVPNLQVGLLLSGGLPVPGQDGPRQRGQVEAGESEEPGGGGEERPAGLTGGAALPGPVPRPRPSLRRVQLPACQHPLQRKEH